MRYFVLIPDGAAEGFYDEGTPLSTAKTPNLDMLAQKGFLALARTIPGNMPAGSDIGTLSIFGYDPRVFGKGRAPIEISAKGVEIPEKAVVFRMNLVSVENGVMKDHSAGHISDDEAEKLIEKLKEKLKDFLAQNKMQMFHGKSYRNYLVWEIDDDKKREMIAKKEFMPPHDILGREYKEYLPKDVPELMWIIERSQDVFSAHNSADMVWFWGQGKRISLPSFDGVYGRRAHLVSAVDIVKGVGRLAGVNVYDVPGATGYLDSNFEGKVQKIVEMTGDGEVGVIHVEATDETGHEGNPEKKKKAIEIFDQRVVGKLLELTEGEEIKVLVIPDHPTPCDKRTHTPDPVPFLIYPCPWDTCSSCRNKKRFTEKDAEKTGIFFDAKKIMSFFLRE